MDDKTLILLIQLVVVYAIVGTVISIVITKFTEPKEKIPVKAIDMYHIARASCNKEYNKCIKKIFKKAKKGNTCLEFDNMSIPTQDKLKHDGFKILKSCPYGARGNTYYLVSWYNK